MIKIEGTLEVSQMRGRKGFFHAGKLTTSIGTFDVDIDYKNNALEQFTPGSYTGEFLVNEIYLKSIRLRTGYWSVLAAKIADDGYLVDDPSAGEDLQPDAHMAAPPIDPTVDPAVKVGEAVSDSIPAPPSPAPEAANVRVPTKEEDEALFGLELFPLFANRSSPIALDASVERPKLLAQTARLKAAGYKYKPMDQHWVLQQQPGANDG